MNIKQLHTLLLVVVCAALAACTDDQYNPFSPDPNNGKTPIELSIGGVDAQGVTRAVITDGTGKNMNAFDVNSKIFMIIKSEYVPLGSGYEYLDYGGSTTTKYTVTRGEVASGSNDVTFNTDVQKRYWDDAHARSSKLSIWAYAQKGQPSWNECTFEEPNPGSETDPLNKYKDYPCNTTVLPNPVWRETEIYPAIRYWRASNLSDDSQNATTVQCQDLLFSNNIANYTSTSGPDRRLSFNPATKHFPSKTDVWPETEVKQTELKFYHAMSKLTIHIKKGSGFDTGDFGFTGSGNIALSGFNKKGLFHIGDGQFEYIWTTKPDHLTPDPNPYYIPQIYKWNSPATNDAMTLEALVIPNVHGNVTDLQDTHSRFVPSSTDVMMEFTINNNKYQITSGQLYNALHVSGNPSNALVNNATKKSDYGTTYIPLEAGKNYHFTFTIGKSKIENITAKVAEWENVIAEDIPANNAKVKLTLDDRGTAQTENVDFYRSIHTEGTIPSDPSAIKEYDWGKGYAKSESAAYSDNKWTTEWFWDDNKSFFHLRALLHTNNNAVNSLTEESNKQYASISSHDSESESTYDAVAWGAPFMQNSGNKFTYSTTNGFDGTNSSSHQIYHAIGATEDPIKMLLFHMMSGVHFTIQTTGNDDAHKDKVELCHNNGGEPVTYTRPKVQLVGYLPNGKVWMGTGLVTADGTKTTTSDAGITCRTTSNGAYDAQNYYYSAIPQDLTNVQLYITTPDNNQYIVDLATAKVASGNITSNNLANPYTAGSDSKYTINRWYPGFKYNYTFTLKKSGITDITATIVDWENVTAGNEDVQIK